MSRVNWTNILRDQAHVIFSSLEFPREERTEIDRSVAAIRLNDGSVIDIEWIDEERSYLISLYSQGFHSLLGHFSVRTPSEVVQYVRLLVQQLNPLNGTVAYRTNSSNFYTGKVVTIPPEAILSPSRGLQTA